MEVVQEIAYTLGIKRVAKDDAGPIPDDAIDHSRSTASLPPELVGLIVQYLDREDLVNVLTLNWTWAFLAASQLWETVHLTANSNKLVFLITRSVPPSTDVEQMAGQPLIPITEKSSQGSETASEGALATTRRGNSGSYPWPTLLPYHSMVQSLDVSLSSADMVQDLNDIITCCTELRSFTIHSTIPTEDLLIRGAVSMANTDGLDPMDGSNSPQYRQRKRANSSASWTALNGVSRHVLRQGDQEAMAASLASQSGLIFGLLANHCPRLERIHISGFHPVAVLGSATDLRPLPPKFDLGSYHDPFFPTLRSTHSSTTSLSSMRVQPPMSMSTPGSPRHSFQSSTSSFQHTPTMMARSTTSTSSLSLQPHMTNIPPLPTMVSPVHSQVVSLHFVNCTVPPQYLLNMLQYALPELTELSLMQSWRDAPLGGPFLEMLARACPRLKTVALHATQNHRGAIDSAQVLKFLQELEDGPVPIQIQSMISPSSTFSSGHGTGRGENVTHPAGNPALQREIETMVESPLGSFRGGRQGFGYSSSSSSSSLGATPDHHRHHHQHHQHPPSRDVGVQVSSGVVDVSSSSHSAWSSSESTTTTTTTATAGIEGVETASEGAGRSEGDIGHATTTTTSIQKGPSALESLRVWFTHPVLDEAIVCELANKSRHPRLRYVEFGSEDPFDVGEGMLSALKRDRPEIQTSWVSYGDMGEDRED